MLNFAIIGAGAGGQTMAAILANKGYSVKLQDIDTAKIQRLKELKTIKVTGKIECEGTPDLITDQLPEALEDVDVIMIVSTTDAHRGIAAACKPYIRDGQIVVLNPGHCGGAPGGREHPPRRERLRQGYHHRGGRRPDVRLPQL